MNPQFPGIGGDCCVTWARGSPSGADFHPNGIAKIRMGSIDYISSDKRIEISCARTFHTSELAWPLLETFLVGIADPLQHSPVNKFWWFIIAFKFRSEVIPKGFKPLCRRKSNVFAERERSRKVGWRKVKVVHCADFDDGGKGGDLIDRSHTWRLFRPLGITKPPFLTSKTQLLA